MNTKHKPESGSAKGSNWTPKYKKVVKLFEQKHDNKLYWELQIFLFFIFILLYLVLLLLLLLRRSLAWFILLLF